MARAKKAYQPIDDDIDGEVEKPSVMDTAVDVLQQAVPSMVITEEEVLQADREARMMEKFFKTDWRWQRCRETVEAEVEACRKVWEMEEVKTSDLAYAHRKMHLFERFVQIIEDAPQKKADFLRMQLDEAKKRAMPLLDAIDDSDEEIDEETGEVA